MERIARLAAATFVVVGGLIHLDLWQGGYRGIPYIGPWFIVNVAVSALLAVALVVRGGTRVAVAGIAFSAASLVALVLSRTVGLFGFLESTWTNAAVQATSAEIGAMVAAAAVIAVTHRPALRRVPIPVSHAGAQ